MTAEGRGVAGTCCEAALEGRMGRPGVRDVEEVRVVLSLRETEVAEVTEEVDDIRDVGVGLPAPAGSRAAGVPDRGLASDGLGEADGETKAEELVEATRDAGLALNRLFALGVVGGGGDIKLDLAEEEVADGGRDTSWFYINRSLSQIRK